MPYNSCRCCSKAEDLLRETIGHLSHVINSKMAARGKILSHTRFHSSLLFSLGIIYYKQFNVCLS